MKRFFLNLLRVVATVAISVVVLSRVLLAIVIGIVLCLLTGWYWWVVIPICITIAVLTVFGDSGEGTGDPSPSRKKPDLTAPADTSQDLAKKP